MSDNFDSKKFGSIVAIPFSKANLTTGESNTDLALAGGTADFIAPVAGSIVGISAACAAITAGTITLKPHKASTEYAEVGTPAPVLNATNDVGGSYASVRPNALSFAAGDRLGISATTTTTLDPTNTLDVDAVLFIQLDA